VALTGGAPATLASGQEQPTDIAVDETHVYWGTFSGDILKTAITGGVPTVLASGQGPARIAVDAHCVYWTNYGSGQIMKVAK
jgi:hypothetical protein